MSTPRHKKVVLVYDKQCPACDFYCNLVRIRESVGELEMVDARARSSVMDEITRRGLDIDQGMVLVIDEEMYYGAEAIQVLAMLGTRSGIFNRLNYWCFRSKTTAAILYPVLRSLRNLLLRVLRISRINNLSVPDNDRF